MESELGVSSHTRKREISVDSLNNIQLNAVLEGLVYESTVSVIDDWDTVTVELCGIALHIHIHVRRKQLPFLYIITSLSPPKHERGTILIN